MKTKSSRVLAILVSCCLIPACVELKKYQNPNIPDAATLTIVTFAKERMNMAVWHYPGEEYLDTKGHSIGKLNSTAIGEEKTDKFIIKVIPNQEFRFAISSGLQETIGVVLALKSTLCKPHVGFVPKPGRAYIAEHRVYPDKCEINVFDITQKPKKTESTLRYYRSCLDSFSVSPRLFPDWHCKEGFQFRQ